MRICVIGPSRFPIAEPFAGGLEAHTHALVSRLVDRGHEITLFAAPGSDAGLGVQFYDAPQFVASPEARSDVGASPENAMSEHHAYLSLMMELAELGRDRFDVVLNVSIHYLPLAMSRLVDLPLITTLHTPPTDWIESALRIRGPKTQFITVSEYMRSAWQGRVDSTVVRNGVDTDGWQFGDGGDSAVWFGRIVPEKGTSLAIQAALEAGLELDIAGPTYDRDYFAADVQPFLGAQIRYLGHLDHVGLRETVQRAKVALVTPRWPEPYGLVAAEAMACGTPVAAFNRGALPEIVSATSGRLAAGDNVASLAAATVEASTLDRGATRAHAVSHCSVERMVDGYERVLGEAAATYA